MRHTPLDAPGNGLRLRVHRFDEPAATPSGLTLLLVHGYMDAGGTWDLLAPHLTARGHVLLAPDLRGFGDSDAVGAGGYYHFIDYVADVDALVRSLLPEGGRLGVVGHSMGGSISCLYAGARPGRIERLALLEGLGPPEFTPAVTVPRTTAWLRQLENLQRAPRALDSLEEAMRRLAANHPAVPPEVIASRARWLTREGADGRLSWAYDPLHRTVSPVPMPLDAFRAFLRAIPCPTLVVGGGPQGFQLPDAVERARTIASVQLAELPDAGHMMHWTRPAELGALLGAFFGGS